MEKEKKKRFSAAKTERHGTRRFSTSKYGRGGAYGGGDHKDCIFQEASSTRGQSRGSRRS